MIVFFLLVFMAALNYKKEGFLAPGTKEGGAVWDGKVWNYISRTESKIVPIDLNTEAGILGEMNNLHLLPSEIKDNLPGDSYKGTMLQVQKITRPPVKNPYVNPKNPFIFSTFTKLAPTSPVKITTAPTSAVKITTAPTSAVKIPTAPIFNKITMTPTSAVKITTAPISPVKMTTAPTSAVKITTAPVSNKINPFQKTLIQWKKNLH